MTDHARSLLALHARTTKLLGVDFHPLGAPPESPITQPHFQTDNPADHPADHQTDTQAPSPKPDATIEPKPIHSFDPTPPASTLTHTGSTSNIDTAAIRRCHESCTDPSQKLRALQDRYAEDAPHNQFNTTFTNIVFGEGNPAADLMFIGEAPGEQEDLTGRPFVGRAGQLLDKMILAMGLSRESVYIANVLKVRPPNNATPSREQALICTPYLFEQIRIISPKVIVTLGLPATHLLLDTTRSMRQMRGQFHEFPPTTLNDTGLETIPLMPTYHPAYLLRSYTEDNRRKVWSDLTQVMERLSLS